MDRLKQLKESLINGVQGETARGLENVNIEELSEAVETIKNIEETMYYCSIVKAMEEKEHEEKYMAKYFNMYPPVRYNYNYENQRYNDGGSESGRRNFDNGRMYYNGGSSTSGGNDARGGGTRGFHDEELYSYPMEIRDYREGKSPMSRRSYMESKEMHHEKSKQIQELNKYMHELTNDIMEMIQEASPEEKTILSQKLTTLAEKVK